MIELNDDMLKAFGEISINFSLLEKKLIDHTAQLINPIDSHLGVITLAEQNFMNVMKIFRNLLIERTSFRYTMVQRPLRAHSQEILSRMQAVCDQIDNVRIERNKCVHSYWSPHFVYHPELEHDVRRYDAAELTRHRKDSKEGFTAKTETRTVEELQKLSADIDGAEQALREFVSWTREVLPPSNAIFPLEE